MGVSLFQHIRATREKLFAILSSQTSDNLSLKQVSGGPDTTISTNTSHHQPHFTCQDYKDTATYRSSCLFTLLGRNFLPFMITCISTKGTEKQDEPQGICLLPSAT